MINILIIDDVFANMDDREQAQAIRFIKEL